MFPLAITSVNALQDAQALWFMTNPPKRITFAYDYIIKKNHHNNKTKCSRMGKRSFQTKERNTGGLWCPPGTQGSLGLVPTHKVHKAQPKWALSMGLQGTKVWMCFSKLIVAHKEWWSHASMEPSFNPQPPALLQMISAIPVDNRHSAQGAQQRRCKQTPLGWHQSLVTASRCPICTARNVTLLCG